MPHTNPAGVSLIELFEGCELTAYWDSIGQVWTIGYGHTGPDVYEGLTISHARAEELLRSDLLRAESNVADATEVTLTPNQFSALVSFEYNTGSYAESTLCQLINENNFGSAADQFLRWTHGMVNGQWAEVPGLVNRRNAERALFLEK